MKRLNLISLFLLLLNQQINATSNPSGSKPPEIEELPVKNVQKVVSNCEAIKQEFDHEGGAAGFTSNCVIKVWNDKDSVADLKDLTPEQQEKLKSELNGNSSSSTSSSSTADHQINPAAIDHIKLLQEEASNRHYMCMEAKRSILNRLKEQLPAGFNSCEKINEALNNLKLSPLLEAFINKVNGPMKEVVARIHNLEQDTQMSEADKLEALRKEKIELTQLLDEDCKDDHPSIRFHNISYLPSADLHNIKVTLVVTHPDKQVEFFNMPVEGMGAHIENLRSIAKAAVHHFQATGQTGAFKAHMLTGGKDEPAMHGSGVISFVPDNNSGDVNTTENKPANQTQDNQKKEEPVKKQEEEVNKQTPAPVTANNQEQHQEINQEIKQEKPVVQEQEKNEHVNTLQDNAAAKHEHVNTLSDNAAEKEITDSSTAQKTESPEPTTPIDKYWYKIINAKDHFYKQIENFTKLLKNKEINQERFDFQSSMESGTLNTAFHDATIALISDSNLPPLPDPLTEAAINDRYQKSKAILKTARDSMPAKRKTFLQWVSGTKTFPEEMYYFSKGVIKKIRDDALAELKKQNTAERPAFSLFGPAKPAPAAIKANNVNTTGDNTTAEINATTDNTNHKVAESETPKLSEREQLINEFVNTVVSSANVDEDKIKAAFASLFNEDKLKQLPKVSFIYPGYSIKPKERQALIDDTEKMKALLKDVTKILSDQKFAQLELVNRIGKEWITAYERKTRNKLKKDGDGTTTALKKIESEIAEAAQKLSEPQITDDIINHTLASLLTEEIANRMNPVPFSNGLYSRPKEDKEIAENEAKMKAILSEILDRLEDRAVSQEIRTKILNSGTDMINKYKAEAKQKHAVENSNTENNSTTEAAQSRASASKVVGDFIKRIYAALPTVTLPKFKFSKNSDSNTTNNV